MTVADPALERSGRSIAVPLAAGILILLFAAVTLGHFSHAFSTSAWRGLLAPSGNPQAAILYYSALPRLAVALLAGASLGFASVIVQVVLRNPIAEPATLGVSGGASLALTLASLFAPGLLGAARDIIGIAGAATATLIVLGLASPRNLSPIRLILGGLIVSLLCGTINALLVLFHHDNLQGMFIWSAGSLLQNDWRTTHRLLVQLLISVAVIVILLKPLTILQLQDENARGLGLSLAKIRLLILTAGIFLSAAITSAVGVIGFVGLAGATLARAAGARRLPHRLLLSAIIGALLLASADQGLQLLTGPFGEIPTGGLTAFLGAPFMLWLIPRLASSPMGHPGHDGETQRTHRVWPVVATAIGLLLVMLWPAMALTRDALHWHFAIGADFWNIVSWRWPRSLTAISAGFSLGIAGVLTQRLTGNPLASPEVLGISSGAGIGALVVILAFAQPDRTVQMAFAAIGAIATLALIFAFARRAAFSPERLLLTGVAVSTFFSGAVTFLLTTGDPRVQAFLTWMAGSISRVSPHDAIIAFSVSMLAAAILPALRRWLAIMPLGASTTRAVGMNDNRSSAILFLVIAILTAIPTMLIGPLSFVGLMSPHIVRRVGLQRPLDQAFAAGLVGAVLMLAADTLGRTVLFPYEIPAGLMASLIGAPYFLFLMRGARK